MNFLVNIQSIYWREPLWLLLAFQPIVIFLFKKIINENKLSFYADKELQPWVILSNRHQFKSLLLNKNTSYILAWLLFSIALSGPRVPLNQIDNKQLSSSNIMLLVDLSRSMRAMDISPNRIRRAKTEIHELLEIAHSHRIGITVFSARPHLFVPITYDHKTLKYYLESLDTLSFPTMGSDPVTSILFAQKELLKSEGTSSIILLTDGDFPEITENQLKQLQQSNIPLYILGIGSVEGEAIQVKDGTWLKFNNQDVVSRMNETNLRNLANKLNGKYSSVYDDNSDWRTLYNNGVANNAIANTSSKQGIVWRELFSYFLFPSIILFIFSISTYRFKSRSNVIAIFFAFLLIPTIENKAQAFELNLGKTIEQTAYREYRDKNYVASEKTYQQIPGYLGYFGHGNSLYKKGHYQKAIPQYISAALNAETNTQRAKALYNLANSYFRTGNFSLAISTYNDVLRYQPDNKSCIYNIKISTLLKENIEKRIKERERIINSSRQGRGPRSANMASGTDISNNTSVSMGDSKKTLNDNIPLPELPNINEDQVRKLIISGLNKIQLAEQGSYNTNNTSQHKLLDNMDILSLQQQVEIIGDSQHLLWKRLFELEEGFPAPVEKSKALPGIKPW